MRSLALVLVILLGRAVLVPAQPSARVVEVRGLVGGYFPIGSQQRSGFREGAVLGLDGALELSPNVHIVGSMGWAPIQHELPVADDRLDIFLYDVGAELSLRHPLPDHWWLRPFVGGGAGIRTYRYHDRSLIDRMAMAGNLVGGAELQVRRTAFRFETRGSLVRVRPPTESARARVRSDLRVAIGVSHHWW